MIDERGTAASSSPPATTKTRKSDQADPAISEADAELKKRRQLIAAYLRVSLACIWLLWAAISLPQIALLWSTLAAYLAFSIVAVLSIQRQVFPRVRLTTSLIIDVSILTVAVYVFGSRLPMLVVLYLILLGAYTLQASRWIGLAALLLSLTAYVAVFVLVDASVLPADPLKIGSRHSHFAPQIGAKGLLLLTIAMSAAYLALKQLMKRIEGHIETERDLRALERAADERNRKLQHKLEEAQRLEGLGRLAGGVAHDFNNILTAILGYSRCVRNELPEGDVHRKDLEEVIRAAKRADKLTAQLLAFSRKQIIKVKIFELGSLIRNMERMLRPIIGEDVDVKLELAENAGWIKADPIQIEQVIMNLVVNARDAMPRGGVLRIRTEHSGRSGAYHKSITSIPPGDYIVLEIIDSGVGMDEQTRERIFEPFFTSKELGKGTGLGLATVYGIVKQNQGSIVVDSELGHGSTFRVFFPQFMGDRFSSIPPPPAAAIGNESILLAEDDRTVRKITARILAAEGYEVLEASGGHEALDIAADHYGPIHLLLTDVVMPKMSGKVLADKLMEGRPETRVLFMSGYTDDTIIHHGVIDDGMAFMKKPYTNQDLLNKVRQTLDGTIFTSPT